MKDDFMEVFSNISPLPNSLYMELIMKGKQEGLKEGHQKGLQEGLKEGLKEGKLETALNMYKLGFDLDMIVKATGLKKEEILDFINKRAN